MTGRQAFWTKIGLLVCLVATCGGAAAQSIRPVVQADISRNADTAHLEFKGLKTWRYDLQRDGARKVILSVPALDEASLARLQGFSDPLIQSVKVDKNGPDGNYEIVFNLGQSDVESFDYLTDEPSRLIVDFYRKVPDDGKKSGMAKVDESPPDPLPVAKPAGPPSKAPVPKMSEYKERPKPNRRPAGDEILSVEAPAPPDPPASQLRFGIFDGGDENYDRFRIKDYEVREEAIISARHNIYLPFPMLKMEVSHLQSLIDSQPELVIRPRDTRENKEARLLLALAQRQRTAVFLQTYEYFMKKYPGSEYIEILKSLASYIRLRKWRETRDPLDFEQASSLLTELVQKYPDSPLREYNHLILVFMKMERGNALATLQACEAFRKAFPGSEEVPQVRKAAAEAYIRLRKYDDAVQEYQAIIRDYPKTDHAREVRYRLGDVAFAKGDYNTAIHQYESAIKDLPDQERIYPNADYNMAESLFWQKDYKQSLARYVRFVNQFPTHAHGGYALTRIGELLGILGADQRRVMGAYLESYFRFPDHPGAKVARIRMLSQQMRGMKAKEQKKALAEIAQYAETLELPGIKEFTTLMVAEGLTNRGAYEAALDQLITYYQANPSAVNLDAFKNRILRNIANELQDKVEKGEFIEALKFHSKYAATWLKGSDRIDVPFFVAGALESAGAYDQALPIYKSALTKRKGMVGTAEEKQRKVWEHLPSVSRLHLRLASVMAEERDYVEAFKHLKDIGPGEDLTPPEVVERVRLAASIYERRNEPARAREALVELARKWQGDPALVAPVNLQLAQTFMKLKDSKQSENYADRVLQAESGGAKIDPKIVAGAYAAKADALLAQKRPLAAVESYQTLLEKYEDKMPLGQIRYHAGRILFERGDLKGAGEMWKRLEGTPNDVLYKIGREKIADSKWRDDYNRYINRIPAMREGE